MKNESNHFRIPVKHRENFRLVNDLIAANKQTASAASGSHREINF